MGPRQAWTEYIFEKHFLSRVEPGEMKKNKAPKKGKVGVRQIAAAAQVSIATVSRVLNGNTHVDPVIQKLVMDAAVRLGADASPRNRANAIVFLLGNRTMLHAYHSRVLAGAESHCNAHGWDLIFLSFKYSAATPWEELHLPRVLQRRDITRSVILAGTNSKNLIDALEHRGISSVVFGNNTPLDPDAFEKLDVVFSDDVRGSQDMTDYLIGLGHRNIGFVGNLRMPWFARCFEGYRQSMEAAGLTPQPSSAESEADNEIGYLGTKSLLAKGKGITAIFAGNDPTAHGVYKALRDSRLRVPQDISVAGCDDTVGTWLYPPLTTIREFPELLGKRMTQIALNRIADPGLAPQHATIPTELVRRDSCRSIEAPEPLSISALPTTL